MRSYLPAHLGQGSAGTEVAAALVHVHGGGFALGSLRTHDAVCRRLAAGAGLQVWWIDYRLAPEDPFPAGLTDVTACWSALQRRWVERGGDPDRIGLGYDSAGGHATATVVGEATAPTLRIAGVPMAGFCWMVYPGTRSRIAHAMPGQPLDGPLLTGPLVTRFVEWYVLDPDDRDQPAASPGGRSDEVLAAAPSTWVQTVGFDALLAQGREYAERLAALGVDVTHEHEPAMAHGYLSMTGVSDGAATALDRGIAALRTLSADGVGEGA